MMLYVTGSYTKEEITRIRRMYNAGYSFDHMAKVLKRNPKSFYVKTNKLGLFANDRSEKNWTKKRDKKTQNDYSEKECEIVMEMYDKCYSSTDIASFIGNGATAISVGKKIKKLLEARSMKKTNNVEEHYNPSPSDFFYTKTADNNQVVDALDAAWDMRLKVKAGNYILDGFPIKKYLLARRTNQQLKDMGMKPIVFPQEWQKFNQ